MNPLKNDWISFRKTRISMRRRKKAILMARGSIVGNLIQITRQGQARPRPSYIAVGRAVEAKLREGAIARQEQLAKELTES